MNIAPVAEVKARFSAFIKKAQQGPIVVTKNGKPVVVILNIENEEDLERVLLANSTKFQSFLDAAEKRIKTAGGLSHEEIWNEAEESK